MTAFRVSARASALRLIDLDYALRTLYADVVRIFQPTPRAATPEVKRPRRSKQRLAQFGPRALETVLQYIPPFEALSILRMTVPDVRELAEQVPDAGGEPPVKCVAWTQWRAASIGVLRRDHPRHG